MDLFVKIILVFFLFFTPFAFAGAEPWAFSVLQGGIWVCWGLVLCQRRKWFVSPLFIPVLFTLGLLIVLTLLQTCFPRTLLDPVVSYPMTFAPLYGWEHASLFFTYLSVVWLIAQLYPSQYSGRKLLFWVMLSIVAVALCAASFPKGDYIFYLTGLRRGIGPFLNRNHAAVFFAMGALVTLGLFFRGILDSPAHLGRNSRYAFYVRQACLFTVFAGLSIGTVLTRSRGGMLSLLVGLFCYAFLCVWAVPHRLRKRLKGIFITLAVGVVACGWIFTHVEEINAYAQRGTGVSTQTRTMLYRSAYRMLAQYPVWGIGVGAMPVAITSYVEWTVPSYIERLHNDWLELALGTGGVGILVILSGLVWFVVLAFGRLKRLNTRKQFLFAALLSALVAMSVGSTVDFHFFIPANAFLFFVLLGLLCTPSYAKGHGYNLEVPAWGKGLFIVLLAMALYVPACKTLAWRSVLFGRGFKTPAKLAQYERALAYYPSAREAVRLGNAYFNAAIHAQDPALQEQYLHRAFDIAVTFLQRYPREKELSALYARVRQRMTARKDALYLVK